MSPRICSRTFAALIVVWLLAPAAAMAQSVISGQVKDNSGGVMPGVTVEASSPVLIEGRRTAVTDGEGRFTIVNLRPGVYRVTFALEGFSTVVRDGLELPADFTATVNATLAVGALQETVTVSGASPIVDVQQTESTQVFSRELLDSVPTGRSVWSNASLVAGVRMAAPDVGGSQSVDDVKLMVHGASGAHTVYQIDGMLVNTLISNGLENTYFQDGANQEIAFQTGGGTAEAQTGGLLLNMVPKDGGNRVQRQPVSGRVRRRLAKRQLLAGSAEPRRAGGEPHRQSVGLQRLAGRSAREEPAVVLHRGTLLGIGQPGGRHLLRRWPAGDQ